MGFTEVLTLVFIVLKLTGVIDWGWFYVLLPEIIALTLYVFFLIGGLIIFVKAKKKRS